MLTRELEARRFAQKTGLFSPDIVRSDYRFRLIMVSYVEILESYL